MFIKKEKLIDLLFNVSIQAYQQCGRNLSVSQKNKIRVAIEQTLNKQIKKNG